ncbi:uncharacterized protein BJ171DRAFT_570337 [Polychytrium aggregatum]|uniref:uncharacterized protein n=1 Tax=Polychytrium aggregatum TaxID=110093 RepID=UPI0022FE0D6D|nr:uncharacterized protein BJ171DRAFT_570337 [Polychytrium aggregatum]KAI9199535.1 hypothetical protein BJ171DRAFT_570337 [Polychytrium aggregatum]
MLPLLLRVPAVAGLWICLAIANLASAYQCSGPSVGLVVLTGTVIYVVLHCSLLEKDTGVSVSVISDYVLTSPDSVPGDIHCSDKLPEVLMIQREKRVDPSTDASTVAAPPRQSSATPAQISVLARVSKSRSTQLPVPSSSLSGTPIRSSASVFQNAAGTHAISGSPTSRSHAISGTPTSSKTTATERKPVTTTTTIYVTVVAPPPPPPPPHPKPTAAPHSTQSHATRLVRDGSDAEYAERCEPYCLSTLIAHMVFLTSSPTSLPQPTIGQNLTVANGNWSQTVSIASLPIHLPVSNSRILFQDYACFGVNFTVSNQCHASRNQSSPRCTGKSTALHKGDSVGVLFSNTRLTANLTRPIPWLTQIVAVEGTCVGAKIDSTILWLHSPNATCLNGVGVVNASLESDSVNVWNHVAPLSCIIKA